jgi:hypothetical protein
MLSPNTEENLPLELALERLVSEPHRRFRRLADDIVDQAMSSRHESLNALGDCSDGVENSILVVVDQPSDAAAVRYAAAWFGLLARQKTVLTWVGQADGPDAVYELDVPERNVRSLRTVLDVHGIPFRTLLPGAHGHRVVLYDQGRRWRANVDRLAHFYRISVIERRGVGEFLGGETRDEAHGRYRDVIRRYEASSERPKYRPRQTASLFVQVAER